MSDFKNFSWLFIFMVECCNCKSMIVLVPQLFNDGYGQFDIFFAVVFYIQEYAHILAVEVIFVVPPLFVFRVKVVFPSWKDHANKCEFAKPTSQLGALMSLVSDFLANIVETLIAIVAKCFNKPLLESCSCTPLWVVLNFTVFSWLKPESSASKIINSIPCVNSFLDCPLRFLRLFCFLWCLFLFLSFFSWSITSW